MSDPRMVTLGVAAVWLAFAAVPAPAASRAAPIIRVLAGTDIAIVVGSSRGGKWIPWARTHQQMRAGQRFRFFASGKPAGERTVTKPELSQASGAAYNVRLARALPSKSPLVGLAGAAWNPLPRAPRSQDPKAPELAAAVSRFLTARGLRSPRVRVTSVWQADLDGDGSRETLVEAESPGYADAAADTRRPKAGDFSVVLLQGKANGPAEATLVAGQVLTGLPPGEGMLLNRFSLAGLLDLNGDGRMEIVVSSAYYEGGGVEVFETKGGRPRKVLECSDGA